MKPPPLFAVDTNFLLGLVEPPDDARDALDIIRERTPRASVLITESAFAELDHFATTPSLGRQESAEKAEAAMIGLGIQPVLLTDLQGTFAKSVAGKLLERGLVPWEEQHDARILAEAAVLECQLLISADAHLRAIDRARLAEVLESSGVGVVAVRSPRDIVREFGTGRAKRGR